MYIVAKVKCRPMMMAKTAVHHGSLRTVSHKSSTILNMAGEKTVLLLAGAAVLVSPPNSIPFSLPGTSKRQPAYIDDY